MKRILSMLMTLALLFTIMPAALAAGEGEITVTTNAAGVYDITDVKLYTTETVTGVKVNGTAVASDKITPIEGGISVNAEDAATLGSAQIEVTSANGSAVVEALLTDFVEYKIGGANQFYYGRVTETKVDFTTDASFGWYGASTTDSQDTVSVAVDKTTRTAKMSASASNYNKYGNIHMPYLSSAIRPAVNDSLGRYVDLYFYADVKTNEKASRLNLYDSSAAPGGFSIGVDIFGRNNYLGTTTEEYKLDTWYTLKAHIDSINGLFEVYVRERDTEGAEYKKIFTRTEGVIGANFTRFSLSGYSTSATVAYEADNLYYEGFVAQKGAGSFKYVKDGAETAVGTTAVPANTDAFTLKVEGSQADALSNIYIKDASGHKISATVTGANSETTHVNDIITITPQGLTEGDYTLVVGKGTIIDNAQTEHDRVFPFSVVATEFSATSPADGAVIEQGETLNLACVAPGAATVTFTVNENEVAGTKAAKGSSFTASFNTASLPLGTVSVETEAKDANDNQIAYEKRYVNVVKNIITTAVANTNYIQLSGAVQGTYETISAGGTINANGARKLYYSDGKSPASTYLFQNTTNNVGWSGKVATYFEIKVGTLTDKVNLSLYYNTNGTNDMSSANRKDYTFLEGLFNSNGCFYKSNVSYNVDNWYTVKVEFDLDNGKQALYVNGDLIFEEDMPVTTSCVGTPKLKLQQTTIQNRQAYASMTVADWGVNSESALFVTDVTYDSENISNSRIVSETAESVTLTLNRPVASADNVKLFVNGSEVDATVTPSDAVTLSDGTTAGYNKLTVSVVNEIEKGDKVEIKIASGSTYVSAIRAENTATTAITTATTADITIPFVVGDSNLLYIDVAPSYTTGSAGAVLTSANDGNAIPAMLVIAVYENEGGALKSVKKVSASLEGENLIRLTNTLLNGGKFARVMLLNGETLVPLATVPGSAIE